MSTNQNEKESCETVESVEEKSNDTNVRKKWEKNRKNNFGDDNKSILLTSYEHPKRPYSELELAFMRKNLMNLMKISKNLIHHKKCDHFYLCKRFSKKEKLFMENLEEGEEVDRDIGKCSVCWKIYNTPRYLKSAAKNVVEEYMNKFHCLTNEDPLYLTYYKIDLEKVFYTWLYFEYDDRKEHYQRRPNQDGNRVLNEDEGRAEVRGGEDEVF